ncbi:PHP domain protein (modular protein) [Mesotoga infera]|uniref:PHP domain protein (Modular protein) n=2 Tax=Mesotoga infera TaxID=1236046 RepID=A0A7Z7LHV1_9BACT|nr:PHP domain protein (modular protein) [Mesotoga infera]
MMGVDFDFHIHTVFSDGSMSFEELLTALKRAGLSKCGITDHFETGLPHSVAVSEANYMDLFNRFKKEAGNSGIEVFLGGETGLGPDGLMLPTGAPPFDFLIASVHRVNGRHKSESDYWREYRTYIERGIEKGGFQILGHVEGYLPTAPLGANGGTFDERREIERYYAAKYLTLDWYASIAPTLVKSGVAVEIHEMSSSPRLEVIDLLQRKGVRFSYGTDSHGPEQLMKREFITRVLNCTRLNEADIFKPEKRRGGARCTR